MYLQCDLAHVHQGDLAQVDHDDEHGELRRSTESCGEALRAAEEHRRVCRSSTCSGRTEVEAGCWGARRAARAEEHGRVRHLAEAAAHTWSARGGDGSRGAPDQLEELDMIVQELLLLFIYFLKEQISDIIRVLLWRVSHPLKPLLL